MKWPAPTRRYSLITKRGMIAGISIVLLSAAALAGTFAVNSRQNPDKALQEYYLKQLDIIGREVELIADLQDHHEPKTLPPAQLEPYENALSAAIDTCRQVNIKNEETKNQPPSQAMQDQISRASILCEDLQAVTSYALRLSIRTRPFILLSTDGISTSAESIESLSAVMDGTTNALQDLKTDSLEDPALPELIAYTETARNALSSSTDLPTLQSTLKTQQANFIAARRYFWKNTIDIAALQRSISELQEDFK
jgi:hypothetical protein